MNSNRFKFLWAIAIFLICPQPSYNQQIHKTLNLDDVLKIAKDQSPQAMLARHKYRASYWEFRSYAAKYLPNLNLTATTPDLNRSIERITLPDGSEAFVTRRVLNNYGSLSLIQNIGLTGGNIFISSDLARNDQLGENKSYSYLSTPVRIGFQQPLLSYNPMIWERRIEPLKYEEAKKSYVKAMEDVSLKAIDLFFDLAQAQLNVQIAGINYSNNDTLYKISIGRYNIGTIAENELLQMELSLLNAGTQLTEAKVDLELKKSKLRSFLGYNETVEISLLIPSRIPALKVQYDRAYNEAMKNNPDILDLDQQILEARRNVAQALANKRLNATLNASFGLTQSTHQFKDVYTNPQDQEKIQVGIEMPILDWGMRKGQYKMAQSNEEVVRTTVQQAQIDFQQNIFLQVMRFNLQDQQLYVAAKADTVAQLRYDLSKQRFLIGKIAVLDLNVALTDKDVAKRAYIDALHNYWSYFYAIRQLTLYDFLVDQPISADLDSLLN